MSQTSSPPRTQSADPAPTHPLVNLRDLGGIRVSTGRLRPQRLWRADDPSLSPAPEIRSLAEQGLTAVLDLRSTGEVAASPHSRAAELGLRHHHLPLAETAVHPLALVRAAPEVKSPADVGRWYASLVRSHLHEVVDALRLIGQADGGVLFHCAAGKDRTGILAAVVLTLLGVDRAEVVADYAATEQNLPAIFTRLRLAPYSKPGTADNDDARRAAEFFSSGHPLLGAEADSMDSMLTELGGEPGLLDLIASQAEPDSVVGALHRRLVD
ncbi:tyrosine-protein phosphatase [Nesterenkonia sp.]|uniref:tyrosine-protein phosphatase n=1 Tax=Nesterenkonia sp. TaxID=704201 RepID=UPI002619EDF2|nr:tyrosine-protein phosphatase [Nesterenkonia sp.]